MGRDWVTDGPGDRAGNLRGAARDALDEAVPMAKVCCSRTSWRCNGDDGGSFFFGSFFGIATLGEEPLFDILVQVRWASITMLL